MQDSATIVRVSIQNSLSFYPDDQFIVLTTLARQLVGSTAYQKPWDFVLNEEIRQLGVLTGWADSLEEATIMAEDAGYTIQETIQIYVG